MKRLLFEEPDAGNPPVRFRGGAAPEMGRPTPIAFWGIREETFYWAR